MMDNQSIAERAALFAEGWVGTPYRHQGHRRGVGADCLGLVRGVWRDLHGAEPARPEPYAADWASSGNDDRLLQAAMRHFEAAGRSEPRRGDLVILRWRRGGSATHCGIATGPEHFVHAYSGRGVVLSPLRTPWRSRIAGLFTFPNHPSV